MYKLSIFILSMLFIFCLASTSILSQTYGEIFTSAEADQMFGPVLKSVTLPSSSLKELLNQTDKYIMFKVVEDEAFMLDNNRNLLHPMAKNINPSDVFTVFSVSVIYELLSSNRNAKVFIEQRSSVLSISSGDLTMEVGALCPPFCPDDDDDVMVTIDDN